MHLVDKEAARCESGAAMRRSSGRNGASDTGASHRADISRP